MVTVTKDIKNLRGQSYAPGDVLPDDIWALIPVRNQRAMKNLRMVRDSSDLRETSVTGPVAPAPLLTDASSDAPIKRGRGRPRKVPVPQQ